MPHYPAIPPKGSPSHVIAAYKTGIGYAQLRNGVFEKKARAVTMALLPNP